MDRRGTRSPIPVPWRLSKVLVHSMRGPVDAYFSGRARQKPPMMDKNPMDKTDDSSQRKVPGGNCCGTATNRTNLSYQSIYTRQPDRFESSRVPVDTIRAPTTVPCSQNFATGNLQFSNSGHAFESNSLLPQERMATAQQKSEGRKYQCSTRYVQHGNVGKGVGQ
ncbi:hypothetical protein K458DRAFT_459799 [Lentithecium fluviatile CBS 122367]|uniref:Uncharacterized protein n=1 Tax=Lentithecium fluviatile CBS 122367 TaxID=1168545 RepID=A0A6G1IPW2_9PLEO|nr:hypothetical protein K458DRAFT_459799 [Lentithecium fluviatile CBS 122367]